MTVTLGEVFLDTSSKALKTLLHVLTKAEEYAKSKGENADAYVTASLAADMKPLGFQIQVASNTVKKTVWRLTGVEAGVWADDETTMEALKARVQKTLDLLASVDAKAIEGKDDVVVELQLGPKSVDLPCKQYVLNYTLPNLFFHLQTAYAILRMKGVPLGKSDYLKNFMA